MQDQIQQRVDRIRRRRSELENHVIDEFFAGHISRREFVRAGSVVGLSLPLLSFIAACGNGGQPSTGQGQTTGNVKKGGHAVVGIVKPATALDPIKVDDEGGLLLLGQMGEYLAWSDKDLKLRPVLAEKWSPNSDGSVWTFKIRQGVKFNDGSAMTADDVAASINLHADPANGSNSLSAFKGVISKGAAKATDSSTVQVTLDAPNGNFPYLVSSDNYNLIVLPKSFSGGWDKSFVGTGPWKVTNYQAGATSVSVQRNASYWDSSNTPPLDTVELRFYDNEQPRVLALQGNSVQIVSHFSASGGQALFTDPNVTVLDARSAAHRQLHMRTDMEPFTDKRVRQAIALAISRPDMVSGLLSGKAQVANDSPFFKLFPSTDQSVAQRTQDAAKAKQLLSAAGKTAFTVTLATWRDFEIPDLAQLVQSSAKAIGVTINLNITDAGVYYGDAVFGKSPWLDSVMGITDYGHRGVPNVFLGAPLLSDGPWNSAHFKNPQYDQLYKQYVAAIDLQAQRKAAGQIQQLLLDETPIVFPYNYDFIGGTRNNVLNVEITGMGHLNLRQAGFKA